MAAACRWIVSCSREPAALALALGVRVIERGLRRLGLGVALRTIRGVVAAVHARAARRQLHDSLDVGEQRAIVAHDDEAAAPAGERRAQPFAAGRVEMVRRLVGDEQVRAREQRADHRDARELAAAQRVRGRARVERRQSGFVERRLPALGEVPASVEQVEVVRARIAARDALERGERRVEARDGGSRASRIVHRVGVVLRDERDRRVPLDRARRRCEPAGDQAREHALAGAVAADDRARRAIEREVERIEQRDAVVEAKGNVMKRDERAGESGPGHEHLRKWIATFARRVRRA